MPPIALNRRRFLSASAAAGLALSQGLVGEGAETAPVRVGVIGLGNRGTSLLRHLLDLPTAQVVALCDGDPRHRTRAQGIVEKSKGIRIEAKASPSELFEQADVDAVVAALPCDLHADVYTAAIRAGKALYAEKPLALTLGACDQLIAVSESHPGSVVHVGYQRRSNPRYRDGVAMIRRGEIGTLIGGNSAWVSSNGPMNGHDDWLAQRSRSGDWMVEQAVHVWDVFNWLAGSAPIRAYGQGRKRLFADDQPRRDVTDHYSVTLEWPNGMHVSFLHSWIAPADDRFTGITLQVMGSEGGIDFGSGAVTFRDRGRPRQTLHPGQQADSQFALAAFLDAVRSKEPAAPPLSLIDARNATAAGLLVRRAVDEHRVVTMDEILADAAATSVG